MFGEQSPITGHVILDRENLTHNMLADGRRQKKGAMATPRPPTTSVSETLDLHKPEIQDHNSDPKGLELSVKPMRTDMNLNNGCRHLQNGAVFLIRWK